MYGTAEFQVSAEAHGQVVQTSLHGTDGHKVGQCLGGMLMASVPCVDNWNLGLLGSYKCSAFLWMPHGADVSITGNHADGIGHAFAFCGRTGIGG